MSQTAAAYAIAHDGWGELVLNRPERRNAITGPLASGLREGLATLHAANARVIVLRGEGGSFCSGLDIDAFNAKPAPDWLAGFQDTWMGFHMDMFKSPAVIICALERYAINGGASMAVGADLLISGETAYVRIAEVEQGTSAPMNLAWLAARTSEAVAAQMVYTGRKFAGPDLQRLGLALDVVPDADVVTRAKELAATMAKFPGAGLRLTKYTMRKLGAATDVEAWFGKAREKPADAPVWTPQRQRV